MNAKDVALRTLLRISGERDAATTCVTAPLLGQTGPLLNPLLHPLDVDHELAALMGPEGARREYLGAVALVAYFDGEPWPHDDALEALAAWWGRDLETLSAVDWIVSAAHADDVRGMAKERGKMRVTDEAI